MDMFLKEWGSHFIAIISLIGSFLAMRRKENRDELDGLEKRLVAVEARGPEMLSDLRSIRDELKHRPDHTEFTDLRLALAELRRDIAVIAESLKPVAAMAARAQEALQQERRV